MYGVVLRWCQPPQTSPSGWPEPPPAVPCHFFSPKRIVLHGIPIKSPTGKKFRSKPQLSRYLGNTVDLGCFDFRTGKMMPGKLQKNKQRLRHDPLSLSKLFWERRLKGLRSSDVTEEVLRTMDLPKGLQSVGPDSSDDTLLSAIASALHMSSAPITGQTSVAAEKNPAIWMNTSQPLCKAFTVTDDHIREQELKVYQARRSLEEALMADGLARAAENTRELLEGKKA
ncbi:methyl-CpG-binding domain protein 2 isoform X7 [Siniperca chuatsi]|uniref:methyl-CpG-binding domain protein 2 isoform X7 n=1 Tax=Siniperca chuatsi TaxID=119488 RepID=UPI001CE098D1|nr:methyl-CpG-binding domain protein 2 isoform X7 [Siniperca chuatsi]